MEQTDGSHFSQSRLGTFTLLFYYFYHSKSAAIESQHQDDGTALKWHVRLYLLLFSLSRNHFSSQLSASGTGLFSPTFVRLVFLPASAADLEFPSSFVTDTFVNKDVSSSPESVQPARSVAAQSGTWPVLSRAPKPSTTGCLFQQIWELRLYISTAALSNLIFCCSDHKYVLGHSQRAESVYSLRCVGGSVARKRNRCGENSRTGSGKPLKKTPTNVKLITSICSWISDRRLFLLGVPDRC